VKRVERDLLLAPGDAGRGDVHRGEAAPCAAVNLEMAETRSRSTSTPIPTQRHHRASHPRAGARACDRQRCTSTTGSLAGHRPTSSWVDLQHLFRRTRTTLTRRSRRFERSGRLGQRSLRRAGCAPAPWVG
jgi:hypothetical protein